MSHVLTDLKAFLDSSPTSWHAVKQLGNRLAICDFHPLQENEKWQLELGKKYFLSREGAFCAFILPKSSPTKSLIVAAHTDSPALKLKPHPSFRKENMDLFSVEVYGAPLLTSWLNRDLALAGRVVITTAENTVEERLIMLDDSLLFIPQLAIHLDREVNEKGLLLNKQEHLCPIVGLSNGEEDTLRVLEKLLRRHLSFHSLLSFDLFLAPVEQARFVGYQNEMLSAYRLDNLASVHASITALGMINKPTQETLQMAIFWDHEEIGSHSKEGAASPFLNDILQRIASCLKMDAEELILLKNHSLCLSLDMAHGLNPNYAAKHDPHNQPLLGKGIAIKQNANQRYASDALSSGRIVQACRELHLPLQPYAARADTPCGSTVGPIVSQTTGITTVDIGCPQLSMHSIREVMATQDYLDLCRLLTYLLDEA